MECERGCWYLGRYVSRYALALVGIDESIDVGAVARQLSCIASAHCGQADGDDDAVAFVRLEAAEDLAFPRCAF
jgi:hypothetical protein